MGTEVRPTGFLVCKRTCLDRPQPQQKAIRLPPDPLPVDNPRVDIAPNGWMGFTLYALAIVAPQGGGGAGIGQFVIGVSAIGVGGYVVPTTYPTTEGGAQLSIQAATGITLPLLLNDYTTAFAKANVAQTIVPANPNRSWLAIYSPGGPPFAFSLGTAAWGSLANVILGPGECAFWATAQDNGPVTTSAITAISGQQGAPIMAWDA